MKVEQMKQMIMSLSVTVEKLQLENDNLKAKLSNRDLNLAHLTDLLDQIEEVKP